MILSIIYSDGNHYWWAYYILYLVVLYELLNLSKMKSLIAIFSGVAIVITIYSFKLQQDDPWKVPENYKNMKNPVPSDSASIASGKILYGSYCISCHGKDGKGTGIKATNLTSPPPDFTSRTVPKTNRWGIIV